MNPASASVIPSSAEISPDYIQPPTPAIASSTGEPSTQKSRLENLIGFVVHSGVFAIVLVITSGSIQDLSNGSFSLENSVKKVLRVLFVLRIWVVIYLIDLVWTAWKLLAPRNEEKKDYQG